eukprot:6212560-Pleurochrysis_carterae.AAC.1
MLRRGGTMGSQGRGAGGGGVRVQTGELAAWRETKAGGASERGLAHAAQVNICYISHIAMYDILTRDLARSCMSRQSFEDGEDVRC